MATWRTRALVFQPFLEFFETLSRVLLYVCSFIYIFPVLEYPIRAQTTVLVIIEWILQVFRYVTLLLVLLNTPLTTYAPFGKTVQTRHAFLTKITGHPSYFILSTLALALVTTTRQDEVAFVFSNVSQTESFNLTAYLAGAAEFIVQDASFADALDTLVEFAFEYAQYGMVFSALVFAGSSHVQEMLRLTGSEEADDASVDDEWALSWYVRTWQEREQTMHVLGLPWQGPLLRNLSLLVLSSMAFTLNVVDYLLVAQGKDEVKDDATVLLLFIAETMFATALFLLSLRKVVLNFKQREHQRQGGDYNVYPAYVADMFLVFTFHFYVSLTSPTLSSFELRAFVAYGGPVFALLIWLVTFNRRLPTVLVWSIVDFNKIVRVNLREPQRFYRLVSSIAISAGITAVCFAYYAYVGNAFEFEFSSGNAVESVSEIVGNVEQEFDETITKINDFLGVITPCATTSAFWKNASTVGTEAGPVSSASTLQELRDNDYFDVCFDGSGPTAEFLRPTLDAERCQGPIDNYDDLVAQETSDEANSVRNDDPGGFQEDTDFVDDEGRPAEPGLQVLRIDPDCADKLCIAFTVLTTALFAATLIPFVNIGAAAASKAARVAWRISQMGRRMLKRARKLYAKRRKLFRFTKLVRKLAAVGNPVLKFNVAIVVIFLPILLVGLLCMLLGFFRRPRGLPALSAAARTRVLALLVGLTLFHLALFVGFFGFSVAGDNSLRFVQATIDNLPPLVIQTTVKYGSGILYLRLCLLLAVISTAAMSISIVASLVLDSLASFRKRVFGCGANKRRHGAQRRRRVWEAVPRENDERQEQQHALLLRRGWQQQHKQQPRPIAIGPFLRAEAEAEAEAEAAAAPATGPEDPPPMVHLNYAILFVFLIVPVLFFAFISYGDPRIRWFALYAEQDDRMADIAEQIASSEVLEDSSEVIAEDLNENSGVCGLVAIAANVAFEALLEALKEAVRPLLTTLRDLRETARQMLGQLRVGTLFAPINLNLPPNVHQTEFWLVFSLPLGAVGIALLAIVLDIFKRFTGTANRQVQFLLESVSGTILGVGLAAFQLDLILYAVFSALNNLDVPLFNIRAELGDMLIFSLYSAILTVSCGVALYMYEFLR